MESELFGYTPGSFTGGLKEGKNGILHYAQRGTLFLDEICELPLHLQVKLLRVLENNVYTPIGSAEEIQYSSIEGETGRYHTFSYPLS